MSLSAWLQFPKTPASRMIINPYLFSAGGSPTPPDIPGLTLWLQGDNAPSGDVYLWPDDSGNGYDASILAGPPIKVASAINGHDAVAFIAASESKYLTSTFTVPATATLLFVARNYTVSSPATINTLCCGETDYVDGVGAFLFNTYASPLGYFAPLTTGTASAFVNGASVSVGPGNFPDIGYAVGSVLATGGTTDTKLRIGRATGGIGGEKSSVEIAELIIYNSALSSGDRQGIEDYLGAKYGITITH